MADKKGGLGRGIGALIPTAPAETSRPSDIFFGGGTPANTPSGAPDLMPVPGMTFRELDLDAIVPNHNQPRTEFNQAGTVQEAIQHPPKWELNELFQMLFHKTESIKGQKQIQKTAAIPTKSLH